jgi:hypothetical protein
MPETKQKEKEEIKEALKCTICGKTSTSLVDGEPSCDDHVELVYENQVEDYTREHQKGNEWLEP